MDSRRMPSRYRPEQVSVDTGRDRDWNELLKRRKNFKDKFDKLKSELSEATEALQKIGTNRFRDSSEKIVNESSFRQTAILPNFKESDLSNKYSSNGCANAHIKLDKSPNLSFETRKNAENYSARYTVNPFADSARADERKSDRVSSAAGLVDKPVPSRWEGVQAAKRSQKTLPALEKSSRGRSPPPPHPRDTPAFLPAKLTAPSKEVIQLTKEREESYKNSSTAHSKRSVKSQSQTILRQLRTHDYARIEFNEGTCVLFRERFDEKYRRAKTLLTPFYLSVGVTTSQISVAKSEDIFSVSELSGRNQIKASRNVENRTLNAALNVNQCILWQCCQLFHGGDSKQKSLCQAETKSDQSISFAQATLGVVKLLFCKNAPAPRSTAHELRASDNEVHDYKLNLGVLKPQDFEELRHIEAETRKHLNEEKRFSKSFAVDKPEEIRSKGVEIVLSEVNKKSVEQGDITNNNINSFKNINNKNKKGFSQGTTSKNTIKNDRDKISEPILKPKANNNNNKKKEPSLTKGQEIISGNIISCGGDKSSSSIVDCYAINNKNEVVLKETDNSYTTATNAICEVMITTFDDVCDADVATKDTADSQASTASSDSNNNDTNAISSSVEVTFEPASKSCSVAATAPMAESPIIPNNSACTNYDHSDHGASNEERESAESPAVTKTNNGETSTATADTTENKSLIIPQGLLHRWQTMYKPLNDDSESDSEYEYEEDDPSSPYHTETTLDIEPVSECLEILTEWARKIVEHSKDFLEELNGKYLSDCPDWRIVEQKITHPKSREIVGLIDVTYVGDKRHGFYRQFDSNGTEVTAFGRYVDDEKFGVVWKRLEGAGFVIGVEDDNNNQEIGTYLYPDLTCAISGIFEGGKLKKGKFGKVVDLDHDDVGTPIPKVMTLCDDVNFTYDPSMSVSISRSPLQRDPYEHQNVYVAKSKIEFAGEGLYAKRFLPAGTLVALFNGIRQRETGYVKKMAEFSDYRIGMGSGEICLDIPQAYVSMDKYCATTGHKACHSFRPNAGFREFAHPRFGRIMSIFAEKDIQKYEEVLVSYNYRIHQAPGWYQQLYFQHLRDDEKATEEAIYLIARRIMRQHGVMISIPAPDRSSERFLGCGNCGEHVGYDDSSVSCSRCDKWFHVRCTALTVEDICDEDKSGNKVAKTPDWNCTSCAKTKTL